MSINFGIYDFFSYFVPGVFYIFVFNELLRSIKLDYIDINNLIQSNYSPSVFIFISLLVIAYVVGQLLDQVVRRLFKRIPHPRIKRSWGGLRSAKERYPDLNIQFEPRDWTLLFALIWQRNPEMAKVLDSFSANNIMLRNISFGLFLYSITKIIFFFSTMKWTFLIYAVFMIILSLLASSKSDQYRLWFLKDIFRASLEYGVSIKDVVQQKEKPANKKDNKDVKQVNKN